MNRIRATITTVEREANLSVVSFETGGFSLQMVALELDARIDVGVGVVLGVKSTNVALSRNLQGAISVSNILVATVCSVHAGSLLCSVKLDFLDEQFECIMTNAAARRLNLCVGERVEMLIKASELSIVEVFE